MNNSKPDLIIGSSKQQIAQTLIKMHGGDPQKAFKYVMESGDFRTIPLSELCKLLMICYCKDKGIVPHG